MNRQQLEQNIENLVKSKVRISPVCSAFCRLTLFVQGELTVISDARVLFLPDEELERLGGPEKLGIVERLQTVTTRQLFLKHQFTVRSTAMCASAAHLTRLTRRHPSLPQPPSSPAPSSSHDKAKAPATCC